MRDLGFCASTTHELGDVDIPAAPILSSSHQVSMTSRILPHKPTKWAGRGEGLILIIRFGWVRCGIFEVADPFGKTSPMTEHERLNDSQQIVLSYKTVDRDRTLIDIYIQLLRSIISPIRTLLLAEIAATKSFVSTNAIFRILLSIFFQTREIDSSKVPCPAFKTKFDTFPF